MKEPTLSLKQVILDIGSMRNFAQNLLNKNNPYSDLLKYLIKNDYYYDEDSHLPLIKEMLKELNYTYGKFKKHLLQIYDDLIELGWKENVFALSEVEYYFSVKSYDTSVSMVLNNLPVVPRVGEQIQIPFFKAKLGTDYFYVESILHEFQDGKQMVVIMLKDGFYNLYWHLRKDEAELKREVSIHDLIHLPDYTLQKKLGIIRF